MIKRFLFPLLAIGALAWALVYVFILSNKEVPPAKPLVDPPQSEFQNYLSASGIIESATENIAVGTSQPGIIKKIFIQEGDRVSVGDPLFTIDDRELLAELGTALARRNAAQAQIAEAEAVQARLYAQLEKIRSLSDPRSYSRAELDQQRYAVDEASARVKSLKANVDTYDSEINRIQTMLEKLTVLAPIDAEVLDVNIQLGEYAAAGALSDPMVLLGDTETLHVRADIDENDAWRYMPGAAAKASLRGKPDEQVNLNFVRVQPYVVPKQSLTGSSLERVDTRVLQVIYSFPKSDLPAYVGQLVDVFIEAKPIIDEAKNDQENKL